jgi:hypothetical protein
MDEVAAVLYSTPGVKSVTFSTIQIKVDSGSFSHADGTLSGDFPLTEPTTVGGDLAVTVS